MASQHITRVLLQVPPRPWGHPLEQLVQQIHQAGASVYALDGDPHFALPEHHAEVLATVAAVGEFNRHAPVPFAGVHLDVEPYLLPGFGGGRRDEIMTHYLDLIRAVRAGCDGLGLKLELDIPPWYDAPDELTGELPRPVTKQLIELADVVTLMDYRSDAHRALAEAGTAVDYAGQAHKQVLIGFETMPLPDEELYFFMGPVRSQPEPGGYWVGVSASAGEPEFQLLTPEQPRTGLKAQQWWAVTHHLPLTGDSQSFAHLGPARLTQSMEYLSARLSARPGFGGFAIHHYGSYGTLLGLRSAGPQEAR